MYAALRFDNALKERELRNERIYATVAAGVFSFIVVFSLIVDAFTDQARSISGDARTALYVGIAIYAAVAALELVLRRQAGRALQGKGRLPLALRATELVALLIAVFADMYAEARGFEVKALTLYGPAPIGIAVMVGAMALRMNVVLCLLGGFFASTGYVLFSLILLDQDGSLHELLLLPQQHILRGILIAFAGGVSALLTHQIRSGVRRVLQEADEHARIRETFGRHVSPAVRDALLAQDAAGATETRFACVIFLDIRGFTAFSESRSAAEVVAALDRFFGDVVPEVTARGGIINKFLGDGFMAMFGAPVSLCEQADCKAAVEAAMSIAAKDTELEVGIGIHCGDVVAGCIGTEERREYTLIGDVVNVAARIESLNKQLGAHVLVSREVWERAGRPTGSDHQLPVKGRDEPVAIVQLV